MPLDTYKTGPNGKDMVIFASKDDHKEPSKVELPELEPAPGLILPNGDINWNCPCLGGMATGPCGIEFREAFSCFHYSTAEPKGTDCYNKFKVMQECMEKYPSLYNKELGDEDASDIIGKAEEESQTGENRSNLVKMENEREERKN